MAIQWQRRALGVLVLVIVPLAFAIWLYFLIPRWGASDSVVFILMFLLYLMIILGSVTYEPNRIREIDMSQIPEDIRNIITTTTSKGDYINMQMLRALKNSEKMSQTDIYKVVTKHGVELSQPAVREYIIDLVKAGLISSPSTTYAKEYVLTEKGRWCQVVIAQLFPKRYWTFVLRNDLGIRRIPRFPKSTNGLEFK